MPIYTYICDKCSDTFEDLVPATLKDSSSDCPKCGSTSSRCGPEIPGLLRPNGEYKMQAVTDTGQRVSGAFGKEFPVTPGRRVVPV